MDYAECKFTNGNWGKVYVKDILSGKIRESDVAELYCPKCKKRAYFRHPGARVWHIYCYHLEGCNYVNDGKYHKVHKKAVDREIDLDSILDYVDGPVKNGRGGGGGQTGGGEEPMDFPGEIETFESVDEIEEEVTASVNTVSGIISCYKRYGGEKRCLNGYRIRDILMTDKNYYQYKRNGIKSPLIVTCRRVPLSKELRDQLKVPAGYTCLVDAYSSDPKRSIYFFIRLDHKEQYTKFTKRIGEKKENGPGYKHRYIVVFGRWERCDNDNYITYKATINSRCCFFTNEVIKDEDGSEATER